MLQCSMIALVGGSCLISRIGNSTVGIDWKKQ